MLFYGILKVLKENGMKYIISPVHSVYSVVIHSLPILCHKWYITG
jgi:hypothetical protein